eukprot:5599135-Amphidinium_carterae.2
MFLLESVRQHCRKQPFSNVPARSVALSTASLRNGVQPWSKRTDSRPPEAPKVTQRWVKDNRPMMGPNKV